MLVYMSYCLNFDRILFSYILQEALEYVAKSMASSVSKFAEENNLQANVVKALKKLNAEKVRLHAFIYTYIILMCLHNEMIQKFLYNNNVKKSSP